MLSPRNLYFVGTALLTAAAAIEGGIVSALVMSGVSLLFYGLCLLIGRDSL